MMSGAAPTVDVDLLSSGNRNETIAPQGVDIESDYPSPAAAWFTVAIFFVFIVVMMMDRYVIVLLVTPIKETFGLTDFHLSLLYGAAFGFIYAFASLPLGWAVDRYNRKLLIFGGLMFWSFSTLMSGLTRNFSQLFLTRVGLGAGEAVLNPASISILGDTFPPSRLALPMSICSVGSKAGVGLAMLLGGFLISIFPVHQHFHVPMIGDLEGWRIIFMLAGLPGLLLAPLVFLIPIRGRRNHTRPEEDKTDYREYFGFIKKNLRFIASHHFGNTAMMMPYLAVSVWAPTFFIRHYGWDASQAGYWFGIVFAAGGIIGLPIHGQVCDWLFQRGMKDAHIRYTMICGSAAIPVGAAAFLVGNPWMSLALLGTFITLISVYMSLPVTALQLVVPGHLRGKSASIFLLIGTIGGVVIAPSAVAIFTDFVFKGEDKIGWSLATFILIVMPLGTLAFGYTLKPLRELHARQAQASAPAL